jgi:outer membrane translocation and assembly module TamA
MTLTKSNVAAVLLAVSAAGVGTGLAWHGTPGRGCAGAGTAYLSSGRAARESAGDPGRPHATASPTSERYYAGGFRSLRGFEFRGVRPGPNGCGNDGGFKFLNSLEYQVPGRSDDTLYLIGFVDSVTVESTLDHKAYRVSAGSGVRIQVPMVGPTPIALDFGFPVERGRPSANRSPTAG